MTETKSCVVNSTEESENKLKNLLKKYYSAIDVDSIKMNKFQGWSSKSYIINRNQYFVKYFTDINDEKTRKIFKQSYGVYYKLMKLIKSDAKVRIPKMFLNNNGEEISVINDHEMIVLFEFVDGRRIEKDIINYLDKISMFLCETVHKNTKKLIDINDETIIRNDFTNKDDLSIFKERINKCLTKLEKLKVKYKFPDLFFEILKEYKDMKVSSLDNNELVICHCDLMGNNVLIDKNEILWILDWDYLQFSHKEHDLSYLIDERYIDIEKNPLEKMFKGNEELFKLCYFSRVLDEIEMIIDWRENLDVYENFDYQVQVVVREINSFNNYLKNQLL